MPVDLIFWGPWMSAQNFTSVNSVFDIFKSWTERWILRAMLLSWQKRNSKKKTTTLNIFWFFHIFRLSLSKYKITFKEKYTDALACCKTLQRQLVSALSFPVQLCSYSLRGAAFVIKTTMIPWRWNWSRLDDLFCLFTAKQGFKIHLSGTQGCSSVVFFWSDEWGYHSDCLFSGVSEKKKVAMSSCQERQLWGSFVVYWPWDSHAALEHSFEAIGLVVESRWNAP